MEREQSERLEAIGFSWNPAENRWEEMFSRLVEYKELHGNCAVPTAKSELGSWVSNQRMYKNKGALESKRVERLESIGFIWNRFEEQWKECFQELIQYRKTHGNCDVPRNSRKESSLSHWTRIQRVLRDKGQLSTERIKRLDDIGFVWKSAS